MQYQLKIESQKVTIEHTGNNAGWIHFDTHKVEYTGFLGFTGGCHYYTTAGTFHLGSCMHPDHKIKWIDRTRSSFSEYTGIRKNFEGRDYYEIKHLTGVCGSKEI